MFERYTESGRRSLFFARAAAIELGSAAIEPEHLLLAVIRELRTPTTGDDLSLDLSSLVASVHVEVATTVTWQLANTPGDVPFSAATRRVLMYAATEVDDLHHQHIGAEHLLLGILRQDETLAARLKGESVTLQQVRTLAAEWSRQS